MHEVREGDTLQRDDAQPQEKISKQGFASLAALCVIAGLHQLAAASATLVPATGPTLQRAGSHRRPTASRQTPGSKSQAHAHQYRMPALPRGESGELRTVVLAQWTACASCCRTPLPRRRPPHAIESLQVFAALWTGTSPAVQPGRRAGQIRLLPVRSEPHQTQEIAGRSLFSSHSCCGRSRWSTRYSFRARWRTYLCRDMTALDVPVIGRYRLMRQIEKRYITC